MTKIWSFIHRNNLIPLIPIKPFTVLPMYRLSAATTTYLNWPVAFLSNILNNKNVSARFMFCVCCTWLLVNIFRWCELLNMVSNYCTKFERNWWLTINVKKCLLFGWHLSIISIHIFNIVFVFQNIICQRHSST